MTTITPLQLLAALTVCFTLTCSGQAQTGYWQDSFETDTPGAPVPAPWQGDGAGNAVVTAQHYSGASALELDGSVGGCWASLCDREIPLTNSLYVEFSIRPGSNHSGGCHPWSGLIGFRTTRSWVTAQGYWFLTLQTGATNTILGGYPTAAGVPTLSNWSYNQWHKIGVLYQNYTTNVDFTYFINGTNVGRYHMPSYGFESALKYLAFDSGDGTTWIDDVLVGPATMAPSLLPAVITQPASRTNASGSTATFTVTATGTAPLVYQWRFNGTNLVDGVQASGTTVSGATTTNLSLANVRKSDAGNYSVVVSNALGSTQSQPAFLTIWSVFGIVSLDRQPGGSAVVWFNSEAGQQYMLQYTDSLDALDRSVWYSLGGLVATGDLTSVVDGGA